MTKECVVNLDHIQTVAKGKIGSLISTLTSAKQKYLRNAILFAFGFD